MNRPYKPPLGMIGVLKALFGSLGVLVRCLAQQDGRVIFPSYRSKF